MLHTSQSSYNKIPSHEWLVNCIDFHFDNGLKEIDLFTMKSDYENLYLRESHHMYHISITNPSFKGLSHGVWSINEEFKWKVEVTGAKQFNSEGIGLRSLVKTIKSKSKMNEVSWYKHSFEYPVEPFYRVQKESVENTLEYLDYVRSIKTKPEYEEEVTRLSRELFPTLRYNKQNLKFVKFDDDSEDRIVRELVLYFIGCLITKDIILEDIDVTTKSYRTRNHYSLNSGLIKGDCMVDVEEYWILNQLVAYTSGGCKYDNSNYVAPYIVNGRFDFMKYYNLWIGFINGSIK